MGKNNTSIASCRFCDANLSHIFVDLGLSPLSNNYLTKDQLEDKEIYLPLTTYVCDQCKLVQLEELEHPKNIFNDYAYFSSYSKSWLDHASRYVDLMTTQYGINSSHQVIEIASNDGYLLQFFNKKNIPTLGIEPAENVALEAQKKGINTITDFFSQKLAMELRDKSISGDLILGNNVLAHVPQLNDFVSGLKVLLSQEGIITMEFPHLLELMKNTQFDTIYHEHFSYFSLSTVINIFKLRGLKIFNVEKLNTHGGSLRIFACHAENGNQNISEAIDKLLAEEADFGLRELHIYLTFSEKVDKLRNDIRTTLIDLKNKGKTIIGYGAPAKGNTLLNFCNINSEILSFTVDINPHKINKYLPGTHIPIKHPDAIASAKPDFVLILPWNISEEIIRQLDYIRAWGGRFIIPVPKITILE